MNRRSFITALVGLPIAGAEVLPKAKIEVKDDDDFNTLAIRHRGYYHDGVYQPLPKAKGGITVHGPELIMINTMGKAPATIPCLRFEDVPIRSFHDVMDRLRPIFGTVNSSRFCLAPARTLILVDFSVSSRLLRSQPWVGQVICGFRGASEVSPYPGSHRPVDFETEILKALIA